MRITSLIWFGFALTGSLGAAENIFSEKPDFDRLELRNGVPVSADWHWIHWKEFDGVRKSIGRSTEVTRSGKAALFLSDCDNGKKNTSLGYLIAPDKLKKLAGKKVRISGWVKQMEVSKSRNVGIGVYLEAIDANGKKKILSDARTLDNGGESDWEKLFFDIQIPQNPKLMMVFLYCAKGWHQTGKAYFDDLEIRLSPENPEPNTDDLKKVGGQNAVPASRIDRTLDEYRKPLEVTQDSWTRPSIRNGTWYQEGAYRVYVGGTVDARLPQLNDWKPNADRGISRHIAYQKHPSKEVFDAIGINSCQLSLPTGIARSATGNPLSKLFGAECRISREWIRSLKGIPVIACDFPGSVNDLKASPERAKKMDQRSGIWHEFVPWCPESPEGRAVYCDRTDLLTKQYLKWGANVFIHELTNEPTYNCQCRYNASLFADRMKKQFGTIEKANKTWNTCFRSFDDVARITEFGTYPKMWSDWCKFSADRYAEFLQMLAGRIRKIDKRKNVYFSEQCSSAAIFGNYGAGMDFRKNAAVLDVLALEGGLKYGRNSSTQTQNDLEIIVHAKSIDYLFGCDFYQALAKGKKPVTNNEHYCVRSEDGLRVPSRKTDLVSSFWTEFLHGLSGSYVYTYDKRAWAWKSIEDAKKMVEKVSYKSSSLLNPYNWPPSELDAFQCFRNEIEPYLDKIAPFPRVKPASVAILYSQATLAMTEIRKIPFQSKILSWYEAALMSQYPVKVVFEDELAKTLGKEVKVLLAPVADYCPPETLAELRRFAKRGGRIIADVKAFRFDERENPLPELKEAVRFDANRQSSKAELLSQLAKFAVPRHGRLSDSSGNPVSDTDFQMIDRGDFKLLFLIAPYAESSRLVRIQPTKVEPGGWYVFNPASKELLSSGNGELWTDRSIREGIEVILPPQERVVLVMRRNRPEAHAAVSPDEQRKRFDAIRAKEKKADEKRRLILAERARAYADARIYREVNPNRCTPVDLRPYANRGFADQKAMDRAGGWFDQGFNNDFSSMKTGKQVLAGVPFDIIEPASNAQKSCLILSGVARPYFPDSIKEIRVGKKGKNLYFLHTMGYGASSGTAIATYLIHYQDGSRAELPVRAGHEIGGWWGADAIRNGKIAVESRNQMGMRINMQCFRWNNPSPEKTIASIDIISRKTDGIPALCAITVEQ